MPSRIKYRDKMEQAILALLTHGSIAQAATAAGIAEKTLKNWLKLDEFTSKYYQARAEMLQHALGHIAAALTGAAVILRAISMDPDAPASARVNAARAIYELALKDREMQQFETRLAALEAQMAQIAQEPRV